MVDLVVHARRARSRGIVAEVPGAVAAAFGCAEADVRIHVVELDQGGAGPFVVVYASGPADRTAATAVAAAVAHSQGVQTDEVVVRWVVSS